MTCLFRPAPWLLHPSPPGGAPMSSPQPPARPPPRPRTASPPRVRCGSETGQGSVPVPEASPTGPWSPRGCTPALRALASHASTLGQRGPNRSTCQGGRCRSWFQARRCRSGRLALLKLSLSSLEPCPRPVHASPAADRPPAGHLGPSVWPCRCTRWTLLTFTPPYASFPGHPVFLQRTLE